VRVRDKESGREREAREVVCERDNGKERDLTSWDSLLQSIK